MLWFLCPNEMIDTAAGLHRSMLGPAMLPNCVLCTVGGRDVVTSTNVVKHKVIMKKGKDKKEERPEVQDGANEEYHDEMECPHKDARLEGFHH